MKTRLFLLLFGMSILMADAAKSGRSRNRGHSNRIKVTVPHRSAKTYYDNENGARITKTSHFEQDYILGRKITFLCVANGLPRPHITWFKDGTELYHHKFFMVHERNVGNETIKSKMEIEPAVQKDAGYYECQADNLYAVDRRGFRTDFITLSSL